MIIKMVSGYLVNVQVESALIKALNEPTGAELMGLSFKYEITGYDSEGRVNSIKISD